MATSFNSLSQEIVLHIFSFLDVPSLVQTNSVSHFCYSVSTDPAVWSLRCKDSFKDCCLTKPDFYGWKFWYSQLLRVDENWKKGSYSLDVLKGHRGAIWDVQLRNNFIVCGGWDNSLSGWDTINKKCVFTVRRPTMVSNNFKGVSFTKGVAVRSVDGVCILSFFDLKTNVQIQSFQVPNCERISALVLKNEIVIFSNQRCELEAYYIPDGSLIKKYIGHTGDIRCLKFSDKDKLIASGSLDKTIRVWDCETGNSIVFTGHSMSVICLDFNVDQNILVSGSGDKRMIVWNLTTGLPIHEFVEPHSISALSLSGQKLIAAVNKTIVLWDSKNWQKIWTIDLPSAITFLTHDSTKIIAASKSILVFNFDKVNGEQQRVPSLHLTRHNIDPTELDNIDVQPTNRMVLITKRVLWFALNVLLTIAFLYLCSAFPDKETVSNVKPEL
eukprot:TRINITY_DN2840_c0_g2_i6.p1 TRINITY_DN2840_c0_g2~~TRINITY_DN2840_c0_g2_i6.p1  ORF type:complete len:441 (-),score=63.85 TRINITY_DN2840_c0_g2_i6:136-1458(-)